MDFPAFNSFRNIGLEDRDTISGFAEKYCPLSCEYGFGCLFIYSQAYELKYSVFMDRLFILDMEEQCFYLPLGEYLPPEYLRAMILKFREHVPDIFYALVPDDYIEKFPKLKDFFEIRSYRDESEYLYSNMKMSELNGSCFQSHRYLISHFRRHHTDYTVEAVSSENVQLCIDLANLWTVQKGLMDDEDIIQELTTLKRLFEIWDKAGFEGIVIKTGGLIKAFSIFSRLNKTTYDIHFEKFDRKIKGLSQTLSVEVSRWLLGKCEYVNREQDVGLEGLRYSKMSYHPEKLIDVYCLIPKF